MAIRPGATAVLTALLVSAMLAMAAFVAVSVAHGQSNVCPENPSPVEADDPNVIVDRPVDGDEVSSPMAVEGQARVFEANVRLTLFDAAGNELVDTFTTAEVAAPELAPFATQLEFSVEETQSGCLRVFEESAADGSPVNVVQVELTLTVDDDPDPPDPPATGSGGLPPLVSGGMLIPLAMLILALTLLASTTFAATMPYHRRRH